MTDEIHNQETGAREVAIPPAIAPERWEDFDGFRETFLAQFTVRGHNQTLRVFADLLDALIGEAYGVMPKAPEGWYRTDLRAALADLRFLQGYLATLGDGTVTRIPAGEEKLARLAARKSLAVKKIADAVEAALEDPAVSC